MTGSTTGRQLGLILLCVALGSAGGILLKLGAGHINYDQGLLTAVRQGVTQPQIIVGILLYAVPVMAYIVLLKTVPLSVLQPVLALTYVVTPLLAMWLAEERVPPLRWVGIGVIVMGVVVVAQT